MPARSVRRDGGEGRAGFMVFTDVTPSRERFNFCAPEAKKTDLNIISARNFLKYLKPLEATKKVAKTDWLKAKYMYYVVL